MSSEGFPEELVQVIQSERFDDDSNCATVGHRKAMNAINSLNNYSCSKEHSAPYIDRYGKIKKGRIDILVHRKSDGQKFGIEIDRYVARQKSISKLEGLGFECAIFGRY